MFKKIILTAAALASLTIAARATDYQPDVSDEGGSETGIYMRADFGGSYLNWASATGPWSFTGTGGIGYQMDENFRGDLTYTYAGNYTVTGGTTSTNVVLGNAYYDISNSSPITPYVGLGLGYGWQNGTGIASSSGIAAAAHLGATMDISSNLVLDAGYHFHDTFATVAVPEHSVTVGLRVKF